MPKNIYYSQQNLPEGSHLFDKPLQEAIAKTALGKIPRRGRGGVFVKADYFRVGYSFLSLNPDVLILDKRTHYTAQTNLYDFTPIFSSDRYGSVHFGYSSKIRPDELVVIGRRK